MAGETEQLVVALEARIKDFERNFAKANKTATQNFDQIERRAKQSADRLEQSMTGAAKGMNLAMTAMKAGITGLVAGLSVGLLEGIVSRTGQIAKSVANIGNEAKRAGLSTKSFQELGYVAEQNRIPVDALVDGMKELNLRADEWIVTGGGSAAEAFARLGYSAEDLKTKLKDPSALLVEIIGRLEGLDKAAQIRIADELFGGTGGERFVELLDRGAAGVRKLIQEANDLGVVLDDDVIARADELDRKFNKIGQTVSTFTKQAVVGLVGAMDDFLDRWNTFEEQSTRNVQSALTGVYDRLQEAKQTLEDLQTEKTAFPEDINIDQNIDRQTALIEELTTEAMKLRDILDRRSGYSDGFIYKTGEEAKGAAPGVNNLNNALSGTSAAVQNAVAGIKSYSDAIRSLKGEVPELAAELANLDKKAQIEAVYQKALSMAQGGREVALANEMRGKALASLNLKSATDDPSSYLSAVLAKGKASSHVTGMQSGFREKLATMIASMPDNLKGSVTVNSGYRSVERQQELWLAALQKYGSPEAARKWVAPPGNSQHNKGNAADLGYGSDAAREWVHSNASNYGLSFPLSNENWHIEDAGARSQETTAEIERLTQAAQQQSDAYKQIGASAQEYINQQSTEQQAMTMTGQAAAAFRYEQQMLNEAQRAGIALSPQQRQEIASYAQGMAQAEAATERFVDKQRQAQELSQMFGDAAVDGLTGIITGTSDAASALQSLGTQLVRIALQAALLNQGPLASGSGTGLLGGLFSMLFSAEGGLASWGRTEPVHLAGGGRLRGPGTRTSDSIPAMLSDGEYVVNAEATEQNLPLLEAINAGKTPVYRAGGGGVGSVSGARSLGNMTSNVFAPQINTTVQASGNKETDAKLTERLASEMDVLLQNKMIEFTRDQQRSGNMLNRKGFI